MSIVFWNRDHLHINKPLFITEELYDLTITLRDLIGKYRYHLINDSLAIIQVLKVYKKNPRKFINESEPYWDLKTRVIDYMNYYKIKTIKVDMIICIKR